MAEQTLAQLARDLAVKERTAALCTMSKRHAGYPFGSVVQYSLDPDGRPVLLISNMAMHTKNLAAEPRSSIMIQETVPKDSMLTAARLTFIGELRPTLPDEVRQAFLDRHPDAAQWVDFGDFGFYRMDIVDIYYVGGFGVMGWVDFDEYRTAR